MLNVIEQIREKTRMPYQAICDTVQLPYPSFKRWHKRRKADAPLVRQPGPPKVEPPDLDRIAQDIALLSHRQDRTQGAGNLYQQHASSVSRRELQRLVALARHDLTAAHRQNLRRIRWNVPNIAWAMDPCEYEQRDSEKVYLNQMQDLASRYKFNPMTGGVPNGEEIAAYLRTTFDRFGAPLFLKRDNGGNLNHAAVNQVLADYFVLPVNSPVHYPPYNGAIEEAQTELKNGLAEKLAHRSNCQGHLDAYAGVVEHDLNHYPRPCLNGKNSCQVYFAGRRSFSKWERRDAYDWIANVRDDIVGSDGVQPQAAWRIAVEAWLKMKGYITVSVNGKVSPNFFEF